ncbi:MAG: hypothetical protein H7Y22_05485 [Gemmatimonadaceae bacterium]|nr:hypothetical protein [Gloeobacterales cyanobacterium ES-bin-141]
MVEWRARGLYWLANASYRQWQVVILLVLGAIFTFLGGFGASVRFATQVLAEYYLSSGETAADTIEGQKHLLQATQLQPTWVRPHLSLAQAYYNDSWYGGAIDEARRAFELSNEPTEKSLAMYVVGISHMKTGENDQAIDDFKLAIEMNRDNARAQSALQELLQAGTVPSRESSAVVP